MTIRETLREINNSPITQVAVSGAIGAAMMPHRPVTGFGMSASLTVITCAVDEMFGRKVGFVFGLGLGLLLLKHEIDADRRRFDAIRYLEVERRRAEILTDLFGTATRR